MANEIVFFCAVPENPVMSGVCRAVKDLRVLRIPAQFVDGECCPNVLVPKGEIEPILIDPGLCCFWEGRLPAKPLDKWEREWF